MVVKIEKKIFYLLLVVLLIAADFIAKYFVKNVVLVKGLFELEKTYNHGLALSFLQNYPYFALFINLIFFIFLIYFYIKSKEFFLLFIIGGGLSNLLERIFFGHVTDFIKISVFPIFNVADMCISFGVVMMIIKLLREPYAEKTTGLKSIKNRKR